jgi:hypothetical protein
VRYLEAGAADELHPVAAVEGSDLRWVVAVVITGDADRSIGSDA